MSKEVKVVEIASDNTLIDKSGIPLPKKKATEWLTPDEIEKKIKEAQGKK